MCNKIELDGIEVDANGRSAADRPGDPLFPIIPRVLEALRAGAIERESLSTADEYAMLIESICGATDDSQAVEQYDGTLGVTTAFTAAHQSAVGQIQWNNNLASIYTNPGTVSDARWCTGTMISADLFLTAGHCFDQTGGGWERPRVNGTSNIIPSTEIATNMHVNFNFQVDPAGNPRPETRFPIVQLIEYRLGGLDFAICRLGGNPGATFGQAAISTTDAVAGDMLCIIGHPAGLRKRIEAGPALTPSGSQIRYDNIDTLGGNSGSGVLRASDGRIVGVHTNGGCGPSSPNGVDANFGQRIVALIAASPTLQNLTRPKLKLADDTSLAADLRTTITIADQIGTPLGADVSTTLRAGDPIGSLKFFDDVKQPVRDKNPWMDVYKRPAADFGPLPDPWAPVVNPAIGSSFGFAGGVGARPFVLATPHHTNAWEAQVGQAQLGQVQAEQAQMRAQAQEDALQQLGLLIAQLHAEILALDAQYRQVLGEYERIARQVG